ncbi:hypothetical protein Tco_0157449 [Tanacetum coccineum]
MPRDCLRIIESKSKVSHSRSKAIVAKVSTSSSTPGVSPDFAKLKDINSLYRRYCVVMISFLVTPRFSALAGCDRLVSEPLVIENSLIPLSRGSFDVLAGMDRLSKRKFGIVCHEKVVRILLKGDEILQVHGERTQGVVKTLMNTKVVEFRIDLALETTPVAKSPYHLAPSEMQELSEQLQELQDEGETSKVENTPVEMLHDLDQQIEKIADDGGTLWIKLYSEYEYEIRYHPGKANVVIDALSRKERVKPRRIRAMAMTIQYGVRGMILAAQSDAFNQENGMMRMVVMDEAHASRYLVHLGADKTYYNLGYMYWYPRVGKDIATYTGQVSSFSSYTITFQDVKLAKIYIDEIIARNGILHPPEDGQREHMIQTLGRYNEGMLPVLWAEIGESSLTWPELVLDTTDKFEVGDRVMLKGSPWKGVIRFGKKGKLAPRYVGPFEILERIGLVAYRLRLPEELSGVHDTFHVSNLKKCLADVSLHMPLDEIKVDKTLHFVEEPVKIMDREVKSLKRNRIFLI